MTFADHYYSQGVEKGVELERREQEDKRFKEKIQQAKMMLDSGLSIEQTSRFTGLTVDEVNEYID